MLRCARGDEQ
jgi:hypothetical protein